MVTLLLLLAASASPTPFSIQVIDESTGRGVPLVELKTVNGIRLWTDSAGIVAFDEPGLLGRTIYFHISSPGYEYPSDGFGYRGKSLETRPGEKAILKLRRINLAERLYRVTGTGIYRDSVMAGGKPPIRDPLINGQVLGQDSVLTALYRGKIHWVWGDTNLPRYPLGNFHVSGATSLLPGKGGLDLDQGVDLTYFLDKQGNSRPMALMPGEGPTWITNMAVLPDSPGKERLAAFYVKVKPPLDIHARGVAVFNDDKGTFERLADYPLSAPAWPNGHPFRYRDRGRDLLYISHPFPLTRVPATLEDYQRPEAYECFTCLKEGTRVEEGKVERDRSGRLLYAWRKNTPAIGPSEQAKLVQKSVLQPTEGLIQLCDRETGKPVTAHSGSVYWNDYRKRWVLITVEAGGSASLLGEVWYAEADTPQGPWAYAVKVATHPKYSFYNPKQHPLFDDKSGERIYFEGTYTVTFSGNTDPTPRYDYNQLMYRLDLKDDRLALPVAVIPSGESGTWPGDPTRIAFFALDRQVKDSVRLPLPGEINRYGLPMKEPTPPNMTPLYLHSSENGGPSRWSIRPGETFPGFRRAEQPIALVWKSPWLK